MSPDATAHPPRVIDEQFLEYVANDSPECVTHLAPTAERAHFDVEVVSNPHFDYDDTTSTDELAATVVDRYRSLREPFGEQAPGLLVVRGGTTAEAGPEATHELDEAAQEAVWDTAIARLAERSPVLRVSDDVTRADALAAVFVVDPLPAGSSPAGDPLAVIALVAMPEGLEGGTPPPATRRLIGVLARTLALNAPLHVIAVSGQDEIDGDYLARCQQLRVGLVLGGPNGRNDVVSLSRTAMRRGQSATEVAVVPCPGFERGRGTPGLTRVRIDAVKGSAAIAFHHDLGSDRSPEPVQIVRPLPSASRVSSSERRLYGRVRELVQAGAPESEAEAERLAAYGRHVEETWKDVGYAALCADGGELPLPATRHTTYNLLLLLRKRGESYDLLLSNHSPQRRSPLADWNTLLMPAFRGVRELLEHLRDDVIRQATERAEDFERAMRAEMFEEAVNRILLDDGQVGDDLWVDELREVESRKIRKVSPTTGAVTEFNYHLVTLLPLIDHSVAKPLEGGPADVGRRDRHRIIEWLRQLDTVRVPDDGLGTARGIPIEAFEAGGSGLRWDPETLLSDQEPDAAARRRGTRAYPGAIWFPLSEANEAPLWTRCPAIVARNRDVMTWVSGLLGRLRAANDGQPPDQLTLGRYSAGSGGYVVERAYPFERDSDTPEDDDDHAHSTTEALARVRFNDAFDLGAKLAYDGAVFKRVWLVRRPASESDGREAIYVYPGEAGESFGDSVTTRDPLGLLRPVQRYVLVPGLERVEELDTAVREHLGEDGDRWGFVRVRKGGALKPVSVTPPIVEQAHPDDQEGHGGGTDFVVCDGNHRIVHGVWIGRNAVPAVAVLAGPEADGLPQPYYARPFGALEWEATAGNRLVVSPEAASKYLVREVTDAELLERYADRKHQLYRRCFRDLETGFGSLGGQGGRWVGG